MASKPDQRLRTGREGEMRVVLARRSVAARRTSPVSGSMRAVSSETSNGQNSYPMYGAGPLRFFAVLNRWRSDGKLKGLSLRES